jgi:RNA-directed DNA polymerase
MLWVHVRQENGKALDFLVLFVLASSSVLPRTTARLTTFDDLADLLRASVSVLHRLEHARYIHFTIPKSSGAERLISRPPADLAAVQRRILDELLSHEPVAPEAHGFVPGRSIVTGAQPHSHRRVVVGIDLCDFFHSIRFARVRKLYRQLGHDDPAATSLALLCTESPGQASRSARWLPQGAPSSPAITNLVCRRLDRRLAGLAHANGFVYTRYADDITFSGDDFGRVGRLLHGACEIVRDEGFVPHPDKTRIARCSGRQEVTGLTVNDKPSVPRRERRKLRAILHNVEKTSLEEQNREDHPDFAAHLAGKAAYIVMVDPSKR